MSGLPTTPSLSSTAATMPASAVAAMRTRLRPLLEGPVPSGGDRGALERHLADRIDDVVQQKHRASSPEERHALEAQAKALRLRRLRVLRRGFGADVLPESGDPIGDGWTSCRIDVDAVFRETTGLRLRTGFRLCAYVHRSGNNGSGLVHALPPSAPPPPILIEHCSSQGRAPRPEGARPFAEALEGDGSAISYLHASLLICEMDEFGALWHGVSWGHHEVIDRPPHEPWVRAAGFSPDLDWTPRAVVEPTGEVTVTLYTRAGSLTEAVHRRVDRYQTGSYVPVQPSRSEQIATGGEGYIT